MTCCFWLDLIIYCARWFEPFLLTETSAQTLFKMKTKWNPTSIELPVLHLKHLNTIPHHLKTGTSWSQAHDSTVIFFTSWNLPERLRLLINYRYVSSPGASWSTILFVSFSNDDLASPLKSVRPLNQSPRYKQAYSTPAVSRRRAVPVPPPLP